LVVTFSVLQPTDQADIATTWIDLFDAMMTTFRWTHAEACAPDVGAGRTRYVASTAAPGRKS
jgi:hypothetical protein